MQVENAHRDERVGITVNPPSPVHSLASGKNWRSSSSGSNEPVQVPSQQYSESTAVAEPIK